MAETLVSAEALRGATEDELKATLVAVLKESSERRRAVSQEEYQLRIAMMRFGRRDPLSA